MEKYNFSLFIRGRGNKSIFWRYDYYLIDIFTAHIDDGFGNVEEIEFIRKLRIQLEEAMKQANTLRERGILEFRYGWYTSILNLREIGDIFNITT